MKRGTDKLTALLAHVQDDGRICPEPGKWHELWELLPNKRRVGHGWQPPLPLILSAWDHTTGLEKMLRLREHIEYASQNGALDQIHDFLRGLSQNDWYSEGL